MLTEQWPCCFLFFSDPFLPPMHFHGLPLILTCLEVGSVFSSSRPLSLHSIGDYSHLVAIQRKDRSIAPKNLCEGTNFYGVTFGLGSMASKEKNPWTEITVWDPSYFLVPSCPPGHSIHPLVITGRGIHLTFEFIHQNLLRSNCVPNTGNTAVNKMYMLSALVSLQSSSQPAN